MSSFRAFAGLLVLAVVHLLIGSGDCGRQLLDYWDGNPDFHCNWLYVHPKVKSTKGSFDDPKYNLNYCYSQSAQPGSPDCHPELAADYYCKYAGFERAGYWSKKDLTGTGRQTIDASDNALCSTDTCTTFKRIFCLNCGIMPQDVPDLDARGNLGIGNTGYRNVGNFNSGNDNQGEENTGSFNRGDRNAGDYNVGNDNEGGGNTGDRNRGHGNVGDDDRGDGNSGDRNRGSGNTGSDNNGNGNSGMSDEDGDFPGDRNSGNGNSGNDNRGNGNTGDRNDINGISGSDDQQDFTIIG